MGTLHFLQSSEIFINGGGKNTDPSHHLIRCKLNAPSMLVQSSCLLAISARCYTKTKKHEVNVKGTVLLPREKQ